MTSRSLGCAFLRGVLVGVTGAAREIGVTIPPPMLACANEALA